MKTSEVDVSVKITCVYCGKLKKEMDIHHMVKTPLNHGKCLKCCGLKLNK